MRPLCFTLATLVVAAALGGCATTSRPPAGAAAPAFDEVACATAIVEALGPHLRVPVDTGPHHPRTDPRVRVHLLPGVGLEERFEILTPSGDPTLDNRLADALLRTRRNGEAQTLIAAACTRKGPVVLKFRMGER